MPRISDDILNCVIYLYTNPHSARTSSNAGGSGFIVGVQSKVDEKRYSTYAVTNAHVIAQEACTIRINKRGGGFDVIEMAGHDWTIHPDADDLAIAPIALNQNVHQLDFFITEQMFALPPKAKEVDIGIGDDVYIVGRFQVADGKLQNTPTLRWGNIAQMPGEPIRTPQGIMQESYLVECHSISGFSGSPVFVRIDGMSHRPGSNTLTTNTNQFLLGIDWGHLLINESIRSKDDKTGKWKVSKNLEVNANSAMMGVVPVWKLQQLLDQPQFKEAREKSDSNLRSIYEAKKQVDEMKRRVIASESRKPDKHS